MKESKPFPHFFLDFFLREAVVINRAIYNREYDFLKFNDNKGF